MKRATRKTIRRKAATPKLVRVEFSHNNSGGRWWLKDKDWHALARAGWTVQWAKDAGSGLTPDADGRWLGALATHACNTFPSLRAAVEAWERVTGQNFFDEGCNCCGAPFSMTVVAPGKYERVSGDSVTREVVSPW